MLCVLCYPPNLCLSNPLFRLLNIYFTGLWYKDPKRSWVQEHLRNYKMLHKCVTVIKVIIFPSMSFHTPYSQKTKQKPVLCLQYSLIFSFLFHQD